MQIIQKIKDFKFSVSIDDPDNMYVYGLCVRDLVEPLKILAAPVLDSGTASQLQAIEVNPHDFTSASDAMAAMSGLIPAVEDSLETIDVVPKGETQLSKGHCPKCGPGRKATVVAERDVVDTQYEPSGYDTTQHDTFRILECLGCSAVYFQHESVFSEDWDIEFDPKTGEHVHGLKSHVTHWPTPKKRALPDWVHTLDDNNLRDVLQEVYSSHDDGRATLAAIGVRTALDRAFVLNGADPAFTFKEKLDHLESAQVITRAERTSLEGLTNAGSAAAHQAWTPKPHILMKMIQHMEAFLHRVFVQRAEASVISKAAPRRPKRAKKARS